ncbi:MAG TPA: CoA transferase [Rhodospirillales bacterium]|jgi:crotonobetainyl-CoA:carnitine CoA-transferase CaiB-like acyl-CoA transferase|nr:CoA transferase [Rhodospirillales bacterium]
MTLPLEGVRILTVEQYGAGPFGTMWLADQGAEVIKIEQPEGGDYARVLGPYWFDNGESQWFHAYNRNKKSLTLDLESDDGWAVFLDIVKSADALTSNLRGDVPEKLGLTYAHLKDANPKIVCAHLSAYGREGTRASWPGFDYLMQAETGYFSLTGDPEGEPTRFGLSVVDQMTGVGLAYAAVAGIIGARGSGVGGDLDISLFDVALSNLGYPAIWYLNNGHTQKRLARSAHPSLTPCQLYKTADGWIYLMCNKEKFWPALVDALGHPEWADDDRFRTFKERLEARPLIQEMLDEALSAKTTAEWLIDFAGTVPSSPILDVAEALENPFVKDEGRLQDIELEGHGTYRYLRPPVQAETPAPANPAPKLGEHTDAVLTGLGYDAAKLAALRKAKVI